MLVLLVLAVIVIGWFSGGFGQLADQLGGGESGGQAAPDGGGEDVDVERARSLLDELTVAAPASMNGYSRDQFPHWDERDGCDARETVLRRDGADVNVDEQTCDVRDGTWHSPFDGKELTDPGDVDIDHLVPLANAWRTGASQWDDDQRSEFANDLDRPQLTTVSAESNRAKGDQDPSQWKPPERGYWCRYAHDWVVVKHHWELSVTTAEKDALDEMLETCD